MPESNFSQKISLRVWAAIFDRKNLFFELVIFHIFSLFSAEPLYQNVRMDHRIIFTFP